MVIDNDAFYMHLALREAWKYQGLTYPNPAVGCTIVSNDGRLLSVEAHHKAGEPHAEVNALVSAYYKLTNDTKILELTNSSDIHNYLLKNHNDIFHEIKLYTTLEPCAHQGKTPSCAGLIAKLGIKQVYVGSRDTNPIAQAGNEILQKSNCCVTNALLKEECDALLKPFELWVQNKFVFFKWAQRLNATVDDGIISSLESRKHVHALRSLCDLLVIGGESVRVDRPTLDARLVEGKAPDILILSREKEFDKSIPLFSVPNRKVFIQSDFSLLSEYKNIMIEGGANMLEHSKDVVDYYLCYIAPQFGGSVSFRANPESFEILNLAQEREDIMMWMKKKRGNR